MVYAYKGLSKEGKKIAGRIEAPTIEDAKKRLNAQGILYESIKSSQENLLSRLNRLRVSQLSTKELSNFSRNLSIYIKAGIPLVKSIRLLKTNAEKGKYADFLIAIETMIEEGKSFYGALEAQKTILLPSFYKQSIKVAEENGLLDVVLIELASFLKQQEQMTKQVKKALAYPLFIILVAVIMVGVMLTMVVPKITSMFTQMKKEVPPLTQFVIDAGDFVSQHWLAIAMVFAGTIYAFGWLKRHIYKFRYAVNKMMLYMPLFGRLIRTSELARFAYISSMLLRSGVPFVHTAKLSANIIENAPIQETISQAAAYVVEGKKFSQALLKARFNYDKAFLQAVALGEETSELPQMLENLSQLYASENKDTTEIFLSLLEPILILTVGLIMGVIVAAMLLPIFSLNIGA